MTAGKRDRLLTFLENQGATDAFGGVSEDWQALTQQEWAEKTDISDGERWAAGQQMAQVTTRFRVLSNNNTRALSPKNRITLGGETYEIYGIKEIGRREGLEITAGARIDD